MTFELIKLQLIIFTFAPFTLKIPDKFFASRVALTEPSPPLIVMDLLIIISDPLPVYVFPFKSIVSPDFALAIESRILSNVFPLGLRVDFREFSSELIEPKLDLKPLSCIESSSKSSFCIEGISSIESRSSLFKSSFKLDNSFTESTQSSSSLIFTILLLMSSFKFVKEDSDCELITAELKSEPFKSAALTVENVKNTQRIIQIKYINLNFNVHNTS